MTEVGRQPICPVAPGPPKPTEKKAWKIYVCEYWLQGRCFRGKDCTFVHAHVEPKKKGICQNHLAGQCHYSKEQCYYQHLFMPLEEYESLAEGTRDYSELNRKVKAIYEGKKKERKPVQSIAIGSERNTTHPGMMWQQMNQCRLLSFLENKSVQSGSIFAKRFAGVKTPSIHSVARQMKSLELSDSDTRSTKSSDTEISEKEWMSKDMVDWGCGEVCGFIKLLGKAQCWDTYSRDFLENQVDGRTLSGYRTVRDLTEDFGIIKKHHARAIITAIQKHRDGSLGKQPTGAPLGSKVATTALTSEFGG
eukprot:CAMPEP_0170180138 /NCGR_PEP_ID=MMETSP0040_2-20121228/20731_1 /TAXON_ID=641309 /ORGANISM="Lotharella oceanica, Strain CCMP622" /LENGTH=305 /DNA_ID=CAMNT_0010424633 /DNA_START=53 /DNA_END=970 /DNA_ORIENTATION=-